MSNSRSSVPLLTVLIGSFVFVPVAFVSEPATGDVVVPPKDDLLTELIRLTEEIEESIRVGDRSVLARVGLPEMLLVNRDGRTYSKDEFLELLRPLPPGYDLRFRIQAPQLLRNGSSAVLTFVLDEFLTIWGHDVSTSYRCSFVYFQRNGNWGLALFEYFERPIDPTPVVLEPALLDRWTGVYRLAPGRWVTRVWRDGGRLLVSRDSGEAKTLVPLADGRFYYPGVEGEVFFEADANGRPEAMVFRRNSKDLRYEHVPPR